MGNPVPTHGLNSYEPKINKVWYYFFCIEKRSKTNLGTIYIIFCDLIFILGLRCVQFLISYFNHLIK